LGEKGVDARKYTLFFVGGTRKAQGEEGETGEEKLIGV